MQSFNMQKVKMQKTIDMESAPCLILKLEVIKVEIGQFSKKTKLSIDTLRYYNKIGILVPKRINNIRYYDEKDLEKAIAITKLKNCGFTLSEIEQILKLDESLDENMELNEETKEKVLALLQFITGKHEDILKKEQEILQVKMKLEHMTKKINKFLEVGYLFDEDEI